MPTAISLIYGGSELGKIVEPLDRGNYHLKMVGLAGMS